MNPLAAGISGAFLEGSKDLIALIKYLGDKELQEKKLGLEDKRIKQQSEYQSKMLGLEKTKLGLESRRLDWQKTKYENMKDIRELDKEIAQLKLKNEKLALKITNKQYDSVDELKSIKNLSAYYDLNIKMAQFYKLQKENSSPTELINKLESGISTATNTLNSLLKNVDSNTIMAFKEAANSGDIRSTTTLLQRIEAALKDSTYSEDNLKTIKDAISYVQWAMPKYSNLLKLSYRTQLYPKGNVFSDRAKSVIEQNFGGSNATIYKGSQSE